MLFCDSLLKLKQDKSLCKPTTMSTASSTLATDSKLVTTK